jgi:hypothetical protein
MWNHAPQQQQMVGPPPRGKSLGLMKLISKTSMGEKVHLTFVSVDSEGGAYRNLSHENAEYFSVGQVYEISATQP